MLEITKIKSKLFKAKTNAEQVEGYMASNRFGVYLFLMLAFANALASFFLPLLMGQLAWVSAFLCLTLALLMGLYNLVMSNALKLEKIYQLVVQV